MKRLAVSVVMLIILAGNTGCGLLHELWYALPGTGPCRLYGISGCLNKCDCHGGCGEIYWGELSDPPLCVGCGPCDQCARWKGHHKYPGYTPYGHHGMMHEGHYHHGHMHGGPMHEVHHEGHVAPESIRTPTPAPARPQARSSSPTRTVRSTHGPGQRSMAGSPQATGRAPTDEEMGLPPGAKIIDRTDRVVGESTRSSSGPVVRSVATRPSTSTRTSQAPSSHRSASHEGWSPSRPR